MTDFQANEHENLQPFVDLADRARLMGHASVADVIETLVREIAERDAAIAEFHREAGLSTKATGELSREIFSLRRRVEALQKLIYDPILGEPCPEGARHCGCVPDLRQQIAARDALIADLRRVRSNADAPPPEG